MKLSQINEVSIPQEKITQYLLSLTHESGRSKAIFFLNFGFDVDYPDILMRAISDHARTNNIVKTVETVLGTRFTIEGKFVTPDGRNPRIRTVWFIEKGEIIPRFVTAYPIKRRQRK